MAEKYGTIPKKFTREWWEYFWMYYKTYVIVAVLVIITGTVTAHQILTAPKYDITVTYAGFGSFTEKMSDEVVSTLSPMCKDVDGNGEKSLNFTQINLNTDDEAYNASMSSKLFLSLSEEDVYIYIMDAKTADMYIPAASESNFVPVSDWYKGDISEKGKYEKDGLAFGVELTDCAAFKEIARKTNADFAGNYLFVRYYPREDQIEEQLEGYNAAKELAAKIVTGK